MSYFQLVQRITVAELLACPSCQSLVSDKRTSAISNAELYWITGPLCYSIGRNAIFLLEEPVSIGNQYACASMTFENASHTARFAQFIDQTRCTAS